MNTSNSVRILMSSLIKARKRKFLEILPEMTRDIRNVHRGQCQACGDCEAFISVSGRVLCDYCGCPPAQHENLARSEISNSSNKKSKDSSNSASDLVTADVSTLEIQELDDVDIVDSEDEDHSSSEEADADEVASSLDSSKASSISSSTGSNSSHKSTGYLN